MFFWTIPSIVGGWVVQVNSIGLKEGILLLRMKEISNILEHSGKAGLKATGLDFRFPE
jgi:hypothetical protein